MPEGACKVGRAVGLVTPLADVVYCGHVSKEGHLACALSAPYEKSKNLHRLSS